MDTKLVEGKIIKGEKTEGNSDGGNDDSDEETERSLSLEVSSQMKDCLVMLFNVIKNGLLSEGSSSVNDDQTKQASERLSNIFLASGGEDCLVKLFNLYNLTFNPSLSPAVALKTFAKIKRALESIELFSSDSRSDSSVPENLNQSSYSFMTLSLMRSSSSKDTSSLQPTSAVVPATNEKSSKLIKRVSSYILFTMLKNRAVRIAHEGVFTFYHNETKSRRKDEVQKNDEQRWDATMQGTEIWHVFGEVREGVMKMLKYFLELLKREELSNSDEIKEPVIDRVCLFIFFICFALLVMIFFFY
jgi:hypothetical protein